MVVDKNRLKRCFLHRYAYTANAKFAEAEDIPGYINKDHEELLYDNNLKQLDGYRVTQYNCLNKNAKREMDIYYSECMKKVFPSSPDNSVAKATILLNFYERYVVGDKNKFPRISDCFNGFGKDLLDELEADGYIVKEDNLHMITKKGIDLVEKELMYPRY